MKCPIDEAILVISDRMGIEIDYCPSCRGVWLDRGELDKILERAEAPIAPQRQSEHPPYARQQDYQQPRQTQDYGNDHKGGQHYQPHKKKRESFLGDLFDF